MTGENPGPYSARLHPWVVELHNSRAPKNFVMKGAQLGCTEVLINRAFYTIDQLRRDVLYILPTATVASDFSKARFGTALKLSPYLAQMFTDANSVGLKIAGDRSLYIRGSRGESNLVSIPVGCLLLDEVDRMDRTEIELALERLSGHTEKSVYGISTPTIPGRGIHNLYLTSTQEHYCFECPCCSRWTELIWPDCFELIGESLHDPRCEESYLKCKECGGRLEHLAKPEWLANAKWVPTAANANPDVRGFHVNQLYSYTMSPGEIAVAHFTGLTSEPACIEFHNSKLGVPYISDGAKVTDDQIDSCVGNHTRDDLRPTVGSGRLITMGVDVGKWSYYSIVEWFVNNMSTDINVAATGRLLSHGKIFEDDLWMLDELMPEWQVVCAVVDADPFITDMKRFARRFPGSVYLSRYRNGKAAKEISVTDEDSSSPMATVDRTYWMGAALGRFRTRRISLPRDMSHEYRQHIQAPVRTYERKEKKPGARESEKPRAVYVETGPDHYAHSLTYAEIALPLGASISTGQNVESFL